jgi:hypothetical protein
MIGLLKYKDFLKRREEWYLTLIILLLLDFKVRKIRAFLVLILLVIILKAIILMIHPFKSNNTQAEE